MSTWLKTDLPDADTAQVSFGAVPTIPPVLLGETDEDAHSHESRRMSRAPVSDDQDVFLAPPRATFDTESGATVGRETGRDTAAPTTARYSRRLSDKILIAFHHACDQTDFDIAAQLLQILETMLMRRPVTADSNRRRSMESLVAAYERLWHLRHPSDNQF